MEAQSSNVLLEYLLFLEGVQVPVSAVSITVSVGQPATANFDIAPLASGRYFVRGMKVDFFRRSSTDDSWVLKFTGILANVTYSKSSNYRRLTLRAMTVDSELLHILNGSYNTQSSCASTTYVDVLSNNVRTAQANAQAAINPAIATSRAASALSGGGRLWQVSANLSEVATNSPYVDNETAAILNRFGANLPQGAMQDVQFRVSLGIVNEIWDTLVVKSNGNIIKGAATLLEEIFSRGNPYLQFQHVRFGMDKLFSGLSMDAEDQISTTLTTIFKLNLASTSTATVNGQGQDTEAKYIACGLLGKLYEIVMSSPYEVNILRVVSAILDAIFYEYVVDPTQLEAGILLVPSMAPCSPPRCNVFFKDQLDTIDYDPNNWDDITRLMVYWPPRYVPELIRANADATSLIDNLRMMTRLYPCPSIDPAMAGMINNVAAVTSGGGNFDPNMSRVLLAEETDVGVNTRILRLQGHEYLTSTDGNAGWAVSDFMYWHEKFSGKRASVTGALIEDVAVGFPACIVDGAFSIIGVLQSATYTVESGGKVSTRLDLSHARYSDFRAPGRPPWLQVTSMSDEEIGKTIYSKLLGTAALNDPCRAGAPTSARDVDSGVKQFAAALDAEAAYEASGNKAEFRKQYRKRKNYTLQDYMAKFSCKISCYDKNGNPSVLDGPIFENLIANRGVAGVPEYTSGRRQLALQYLLEYTGRTGINDE